MIKLSLHGAPGLTMLVMLSMPGVATGAAWDVTPTLRLRESYTDNMNLAPPDQARGQFITEVAPGVLVSTDGPRLQLTLAYTLQQVAYTRRPDRRSQQLDANGHAELLADWLFLDARAGISQQNVSAFGPQLIDPALSNRNTSTVRTQSISPYLRHDFRGLATAVLRYDYQHAGSGGLLDVRSRAASLQLTGDNGGRGANWDLSLQRTQMDDAALAPVTMSNAALTLSYPLNSSLALFATAGYERQDYHSASAQPQGRFGTLGGVWTPSPRTRVSASIGHRFFGQTYALDASYRLRSMFWTLSYNEDITTTHGEFFSVRPDALSDFLWDLWATRIPDPQLRLKTIQVFLAISQMLGKDGNVNFFSHRYYLQKQGQLSGVYSTARSALAVHLSRTDRSGQTTNAIDSVLLGPDQLSLTDHTRQTSLQIGWNWRMSARGGLNVGASHARARSLTTGREDRNSALTLSLTRQLSSRVSASADLRHVRHTSSAGGAYRENGVGASLIVSF
ncbi:TIGR03016 family PEP-CTERM system-associated outer membrane protein [Duganella sp. FT134W]|uniref:TIGR03016 family PEP-CTERM system-associated outer membrane protein n=1 Tax=Duganella margarita TaxID=2692170 RepID=A0A7X4GZZ5_9BURK|nr:TIGR03016 family PEP-CTERM system-associated outer membrane protein [Duganella margarita]MYM71699.1 TIGR03016 family PEP-CTERM system-associated outer membrane protein [Duganella margarita]